MTAAPLSRRRAETREKLMDAALAVFAERGILAASVEEICEQANFTRGAFYSNFASKDDLVMALLRREAAEQIAQAEAAIAKISSDHAESAGLDADAKISLAVAAFAGAQSDDRAKILVLRELRTHAVRNRDITEDYLAFDLQCGREVAQLTIDALRLIDREFILPADQSVAMIVAVFEHALFDSLLHQRDEATKVDLTSSLELLIPFLSVISRPIP